MSVVHSGVALSQGLPAGVRADLLSQEIVQSVDAGDRDQTRRLLDAYFALVDEGVEVPSPLRLLDAKVAFEQGNASRAVCGLEGFLSRIDRTDPQYAAALSRYREYTAAASQVGGSPNGADAAWCAVRRKRIGSADSPSSAMPLAVQQGAAKVVFCRVKESAGSANTFWVLKNSRRIGRILNGASLTVDVEPGMQEFSLEIAYADGTNSPNVATLKIVAREDEPQYVRASSKFGWDVRAVLSPITQSSCTP